ncbi:GNAT family N-acetyltransferase [Oscillatoriales cyanobacterium LEGE 11467]|uniref:GNAT family N-acetyltransferase n=1 Tax=Zarconia navalis LEGE 11467 TaxID=1828826 RepID=A0A928W1A4_9CYAN|nr:GNAT family N-acetyltransferase [Zarconia navalis]MBE9042058.1 GNAT family N-acetyltransferase [Zarconia navalis LEGE 11467]
MSVIREYEKRDLNALLSIWVAASEVAHPFLTREFLVQEKDNIPKLYLPNTQTWVAEEDERVVGFISLMGNEVGALFVHPDYHRKAIGGRLMDKARELRGELDVEVFAANPIGRAFYAKYGFEPVEEKIHEQTGFDLIRLRLS